MFNSSLEILERAVEENVVHGYALAVGKRDRLLCSMAGGRLGGAGSPPVTEKTRYDLDALTQVMVTLPLMLLALENGRIALNDPISLYVKAPEDKRAITLKHLLCHASGMEANFLLEQEAENRAEALQALLRHPLAADVGKRVRYSGMGFLLLGKILEQIYDMPLDAAAKKYIFGPLGLKNTGYLPTGGDIAYTDTDVLTGEPRIGMPTEGNTRFLHGVSGRAGLFSEARDCARFLSVLANGGKLGGEMFLTPEALRLLSADDTPGMKAGWSLGFRLPGGEAAFMGDLWPGTGYGLMGETGATLAVDPVSGVYVALLTNRVRMAHEGRMFSRLVGLVYNSAYAQALRMEEPI